MQVPYFPPRSHPPVRRANPSALVRLLADPHVLRRAGVFDGLAAARGRREGQAPRAAELEHHDPPCVPLQGLRPDTLADHPIEPSGGASGQASDIAIHAREILRVREALTRIYQRHCGKPGESVEDGMQRFGASQQCCICVIGGDTDQSKSIEKALERDYFLTGASFAVVSCARAPRRRID